MFFKLNLKSETLVNKSNKILVSDVEIVKTIAGNLYAKAYAEKVLKNCEKGAEKDAINHVTDFAQALYTNGFCNADGKTMVLNEIEKFKNHHNTSIVSIIKENKELFPAIYTSSDSEEKVCPSELYGKIVQDVFISIGERFSKVTVK